MFGYAGVGLGIQGIAAITGCNDSVRSSALPTAARARRSSRCARSTRGSRGDAAGSVLRGGMRSRPQRQAPPCLPGKQGLAESWPGSVLLGPAVTPPTQRARAAKSASPRPTPGPAPPYGSRASFLPCRSRPVWRQSRVGAVRWPDGHRPPCPRVAVV